MFRCVFQVVLGLYIWNTSKRQKEKSVATASVSHTAASLASWLALWLGPSTVNGLYTQLRACPSLLRVADGRT